MAKWGKVDYRQLKRLQKRLEQFEKVDRDKLCEEIIKNLAARMLAKVIKRTPVRQYDKPVSFVTEDGKPVSFSPHTGKTGGTLRRGWTIGPVVKKGDIYEIEVINPVYYAIYVEFGHRTANHAGWVPGRFMMTISEQELEREGPKIIEKVLKKRLQEVFGDDG